MENKYYTPELEDLCYGLEYQIVPATGITLLNFGTDNEEVSETFWNTEFEDRVYGEYRAHTFDPSFEDAIKHEKIRVKYLDKSDIQELGWKFLSEYSDEDKEVMTFQKGNWVLVYNFTIKKMFIFVKDYSEEHDLFGSARDVKISGLEVKNKSELKILIRNLKMGE